MKISLMLEHPERGQGRSMICRFGGEKLGMKFSWDGTFEPWLCFEITIKFN